MQTNDILAKLLANENINVIRGSHRTASFDIVRRVLTLPQWKDLSNEAEEMLILHEVGHALYTGTEYITAQEDKQRLFGHYLNVIEDARIERKMKDRYPGARKSFTSGYNYLMNKDFFSIKGKDVNTFNLIDRINLFYKLGNRAQIKFSNEEFEFIKRIDKTETIQDVIDITNDVFEYSRKQLETQLKQLEDIIANDGEDEDEDEDFDYEDIEDDEDEDGDIETHGKKSKSVRDDIQIDESKLESITQSGLHKNLEDSADSLNEYRYFIPKFGIKHNDSPIVGYKRIIKEIAEYNESHSSYSITRESAIDFKNENIAIISNMVKEFEMRKSAENYKRTQSAKTGRIDANKLFAYKIKDDLFKQLSIVKDGKNHGMIMLLDWSGSMEGHIENTIKQVINLVMFARRISIPFQVFAFTDYYNRLYEDKYVKTVNGIGENTRFSLLEFFNDRMTEKEFITMSSILLSHIYYRNPDFRLGGTPLNDSLVHMIDYVGEFKKNHSIDKMIFITLTDGESAPLYAAGSNESLIRDSRYEPSSGSYKKVKNIIKDDVTGKEYQINGNSNSQMFALMNLIKDRYDTINVGFNIINRREVSSFSKIFDASSTEILIKLRSEKYVHCNLSGYSTYYLIDNKSLNVVNEIDLSKIDINTNSRIVSKVLTKSLNRNKTSRVVLNKFVGVIA